MGSFPKPAFIAYQPLFIHVKRYFSWERKSTHIHRDTQRTKLTVITAKVEFESYSAVLPHQNWTEGT
jgi:hypothetical protein